MKLDTPTIVIISTFIDFVLTLILFHTWRTRTTYDGFGTWIAAIFSWTVGSTCVLLFFNLQPLFISKIIGISLILLHPLLMYEGIRRFYGIRMRWWGTPLNFLLVLACLVNQVYFLYIFDDIARRSAVFNVVLAVLFARNIIEPLLYTKPRSHSMQWIFSISMVPLVALIMLRAWHFITISRSVDMILIMAQDVLLLWTLLYGLIVELVIAYSFLSLTSDRVEVELREAQHAAEGASRAKSSFLGMVSHEMRTPLATISGIGEILARQADFPMQEQLIPLLRQSTGQILRHIDDLLDLTRIESGTIRLESLSFSLPEMLNEIRNVIQPQIAAKNLILVSERSADLPAILVGDRQRIIQILVNMLHNAIKSTSEGTIFTSVSRRGDEILFSVTDTGCGIKPEHLKTIFEPFVTMSTGGGTGLGLPISRQLAEAMGGWLSVESTHGTGSCFTLALPCLEADTIGYIVDPCPLEPFHITHPLQVLAVDDLPENLILLRLLLSGTPIVLTTVGSGYAALELLHTRHYDVLLTDLRMAGMDGLTLVRTIRAEEREIDGLPLLIIAISANAFPEDRRSALEAGCDSYLPRPFDTASLLREMSVSVMNINENGACKSDQLAERTELELQFGHLREAARTRIAASSATIEAALLCSDTKTIREEGHRIKGLGMSLGLPDAERVGTALEQAGREGKIDGVLELLKELRGNSK